MSESRETFPPGTIEVKLIIFVKDPFVNFAEFTLQAASQPIFPSHESLLLEVCSSAPRR